ALFLRELDNGGDLHKARTMTVSAVVLCEAFYLINSRHILRSVLSLEGLVGNRYVPVSIAACALLQFAYTVTPPLQAVFRSTPLNAAEWARVIGAGALLFAVAELEKAIMRA